MNKLVDGYVRSDAYLKTLFENGDKPTEDDFADLIESKAHKKEVFLKTEEATNEDIDRIISELFSISDDAYSLFGQNKPSKTIKNSVNKSEKTNKSSNSAPKKKVKIKIKK